MTTFQVDSTAVLDATRTAQATLEQLRGDATQLTATLTALQGSWSGQAANAFQQVLANWTATQRTIETQMVQLQHVLATAAQQYQESELRNYQMFAAGL
ncbi:WXG100 family type VII secretion target [Gryllotalpicola reticulitermitis]|uniref:ESAT-6-like protein n=1 Tax=Gryllotalpicola reticulitermitis TaxID=1184153 RepID=A0ABV8Q4I1_9MICO